jgi:hypothetical protein
MTIDFHNVSSDLKTYYSKPGIYMLHCVQNDLVLFGESENAFKALQGIFYELYYRTSENEELLEDFKEYGEFSFRFEVLDCRDEMKDPKVRKETLNKRKTNWGLDFLYDDIERS